MGGSGLRKAAVGTWLLRLVMPALDRSWRWSIDGRERLDALLATETPHVLAFWHDRTPVLTMLFRKLRRKGLPLTLLASRSGDGQVIAGLAEAWQVDVVRGSSSRGGGAAIRALHRVLTKGGSSVIFAPDGPRGPRHDAKPGLVALSRLSQAPILPLTWAADRAWTLRSWDRMQIPRPFARVAVAVGAPYTVPRDLPEGALEQERSRLEADLEALGAHATGLLESSDRR